MGKKNVKRELREGKLYVKRWGLYKAKHGQGGARRLCRVYARRAGAGSWKQGVGAES